MAKALYTQVAAVPSFLGFTHRACTLYPLPARVRVGWEGASSPLHAMAPRPRRARSANSFSAWGEPFLHRSRTPDFGAAAARTDTDCGHALLCRRPQSPPSKRVYGSPTSLGTASKPWRSTSATGARELHLPELSYPFVQRRISISKPKVRESEQSAGRRHMLRTRVSAAGRHPRI